MSPKKYHFFHSRGGDHRCSQVPFLVGKLPIRSDPSSLLLWSRGGFMLLSNKGFGPSCFLSFEISQKQVLYL